MPDQAIHKVIITGTGRAGTTFLMQLLTAIGLVVVPVKACEACKGSGHGVF